MRHDFVDLLRQVVEQKDYILIYPEQEMWFNYRKPRPCKRGAYYYASKLGVPVISCFTEVQDLDTMDDDHFKNVQYTLHILDPIFRIPPCRIVPTASRWRKKTTSSAARRTRKFTTGR